MIPIHGPQGGEPSEPPDTPRSAGSGAPGEKRPPAGAAERPQPSKPEAGKAAESGKADEAAKPAAPEDADEGLGADEFDDLLTSLRAALEETEEAAAAAAKAETSEPSEVDTGEADTGEAGAGLGLGGDEGVSDGFTFPDWLSGIDAAVEEVLGTVGPSPAPAKETPAAPKRPPPPDAPPRRRYVYRSFESSRVEAHKLSCRVTLASAGREYSGVAEGAAIPGVRAEIAARATLSAVSSAEDGAVVLSLIAARVLRFVDLPLVVVSVYGVNGDEIKRLVGAAPVDNSEEQAAVLATLQATDRWLAATALGY